MPSRLSLVWPLKAAASGKLRTTRALVQEVVDANGKVRAWEGFPSAARRRGGGLVRGGQEYRMEQAAALVTRPLCALCAQLRATRYS